MQPTNSEVVVAAADYNLTTLAAIKLEYDIQTTDQDAYLESKIPRVSDAIASYCNRIFALQTYQDSFRSHFRHWGHIGGRIGSILFLSQRPLVPGSVSVTRDEELLVEDTDYQVLNGRGEIKLLWESWGQEIDVVYSAGWVLPGWAISSGSGAPADTLPPVIEDAALMMILSSRQAGRLAWTNRDPFVRGETVEGVGSFQYSQTAIGSSSSSALGGIAGTAVAEMLAPFVLPIMT
jgi:hypothetical protein